MKTWAGVIAANRARKITRSHRVECVRGWTICAQSGMLVLVRAIVAAALLLVAAACGAEAPEQAPVDFAQHVGAMRQMGTHKLAVPVPRVLGAFARDGDRYTAPYGRGTATLTLDAPLHDALTSDLKMGRPQWGATVILDVQTGEVLALAEHSEREPGMPGAATRPMGKAASVFKIVTASALVRAGVPLSLEVCGSGGKSRLKMKNFMDEPGGRCVRFEDIVAYSQNVTMGKLAGRYLRPETLIDEAELFGFGRDNLAIDLEVAPSTAVIPEDLFGFAKAAAGFGDVRLSGLHGAVLAATVGNGGLLVPPRIIESVEGEVMPAPRNAERVLDEQHAAVLQAMMSAAVEYGTAHNAFHGKRSPYGKPAVVDVPVAGKTGSLTDRDVDLDTTWFVGTAPAHAPKIAIATVIINDEWIWHVRALDVATRAVATYFRLHPEDARESAPVASRSGGGASGVGDDRAAHH
jgi:peptidoglycan glycosyltransferase